MNSMPRDGYFDSTYQLLSNPYGYIGDRCTELGTDVFETRILLERTVCMMGARAAQIFYDSQRFQRQGAAPEPLRATLFGKGAVQSLDGAAHQHRKALFMHLLGPGRIASLAEETRRQWEELSSHWTPCSTVALYEAAHEVLARAAFRWAGVPVADRELSQRTGELVSLFNDAARGLLLHCRSRAARRNAESWLEQLITSVRGGQTSVASDGALNIVANHRDAAGALLAPRIAAVELLNVLRPIIAISVYIVWCAHALYRHPPSREALVTHNRPYLHWFVQEVRRYYPFFPAVVARVRRDFEWQGFYFPQGKRVMLDLYGTNHDARTWSLPDKFNPERFEGFYPGEFAFVPQGGGQAGMQHRCPGEDITLVLMEVTVRFLVDRLSYSIVSKDLRINTTRLPALPHAPLFLKLAGRKI